MLNRIGNAFYKRCVYIWRLFQDA